jgi:hypothetical protein
MREKIIPMNACLPATAAYVSRTEHGTIRLEIRCLGKLCSGQLGPSEARMLIRELDKLATDLEDDEYIMSGKTPEFEAVSSIDSAVDEMGGK